MREIDIRHSHIRRQWRPMIFGVSVSMLALTLALALAGCGGVTGTTTTTAAPVPGATTSTGLPGELTTVPTTVPTTATTGEETTTSVGTGQETTTTTGIEGGTTTTEKLSTAEQRLANGHIKAMGYMKKVWEQGGKRYISIDYAEMLTGQAAVDAAIADGVIPPGGSLDTDYYIKNTSNEKRQFEVSAAVAITTSSWQGKMDNPVTWEVFKSFWSATPPDEEAGLLRDSPWWIERDGQTVIKIDEQYLP